MNFSERILLSKISLSNSLVLVDFVSVRNCTRTSNCVFRLIRIRIINPFIMRLTAL